MSDEKLPEAPADRVKFPVNGELREIFMSYGMLSEIVSLIGNAAHVTLVPIDRELSRGVLTIVLAERDAKGKMLNPVDIDEIGLAPAEAMPIFQWVMGHSLGFFLNAIEAAAEVGKRFGNKLEGMFPPSPDGSKASLATVSSAGPTA